MIFRNRKDAGIQLARALLRFKPDRPVVLALPRGGVPVAFEVARALEAPLDLVLVRKIGAPHQPELAVAAVVDGEKTQLVLNEDVIQALAVPQSYIQQQTAGQIAEIERRRRAYLGGRASVPVQGRTVLVIDDGVATGATTRVALRSVRSRQPSRLVLAVPVAARETLDSLRAEVDEVVCLSSPSSFGAVGQFYLDFRQVDDDEVRRLLAEAARPAPAADTAP